MTSESRNTPSTSKEKKSAPNASKSAISNAIAPGPVSRSNPSSWIDSEIVQISVDENETKYSVHKALLTAYIPYYKGCLNLAFSEGQSLKVKMDKDEGSVIDGLLGWLYTGTLDSVQDRLGIDTAYTLRLYRLADKLLIPDLKNRVIDGWRNQLHKHNWVPDAQDVVYVSELGLLDSRLGTLILRHVVWSFHKHTKFWNGLVQEEENAEDGSVKLRALFNDANAMAEIIKLEIQYRWEGWDDPTNERSCDFHEHDDGEKCDAVESAGEELPTR